MPAQPARENDGVPGDRALTAERASALARPDPRRRPPAPRARRVASDQRVLGAVGIVLFLAVWELVGRSSNEVVLVPASRVATDIWNWSASGDILPDLKTSGLEFVLGVTLGTAVGIGLGVVMGLARPVQGLLRPLVLAFYSAPLLAFAPLFVIWLGYGLSSKVVLIAMLGIFPLLVNTETGIRQVDRSYLDVGRSYGATTMQLIWHVRMPAALPFVFAGVQIAITRATVGVFVAELFGATSGVGYAITNAAAVFNTQRVLAGVVVLSVFGIVMTWIARRVSEWATPWLKPQRLG